MMKLTNKLILLLVVCLLVAQMTDAKKNKKKKKKKGDKKEGDRILFIQGGDDAPDVDFKDDPDNYKYWAAAWISDINAPTDVICSATWVSKWAVLTTTNCATKIPEADLRVTLRDRDTSVPVGTDQDCEVRWQVTQTNPISCDLSLLTLAPDTTDDCPSLDYIPVLDCQRATWGVDETKDFVALGFDPSSDDVLQYKSMSVTSDITLADCINDAAPITLDPNCHLCMVSDNKKGPCELDEGGPIFYYVNSWIAGIAYKPRDCNDINTYSVYVDISKVCADIFPLIGGGCDDPGVPVSEWTTWKPTTQDLGLDPTLRLSYSLPYLPNFPCPGGAVPICVESRLKDPPDVLYTTEWHCGYTGYGYYQDPAMCDTGPDLEANGVLDVTSPTGITCSIGEPLTGACLCCQTEHRFRCYEGAGPTTCS